MNTRPRTRPPVEARSRRPTPNSQLATSSAADAPDRNNGASGADERQRKIELAAYYRAERRGFAPGNELEDWLAAEAEVD
jgi:hypothetical protein